MTDDHSYCKKCDMHDAECWCWTDEDRFVDAQLRGESGCICDMAF